MKPILILMLIAWSNAAKLDRTYLPPEGAAAAGGSPGSLTAPFGSQSSGPSAQLQQGAQQGLQAFNRQPQGILGGQNNAYQSPGSTESSGFEVAPALFGAQGSLRPATQAQPGPSGPSYPSAGKPAGSGFPAQGGVARGPGASGSYPGAPQSGYNQGFSGSANYPTLGSGQNAGANYPSQSAGPSGSITPGAQSFGQQAYTQSQRPQAAQDQAAEILRYDNQIDGDSFAYSFETSNGISAEENGVATNGVQAQGAFAYTGDDGQRYSVTYTADENGYQPKGDHLPTPPPIPEEILRSIEENARAAAAGTQEGAYQEDYDSGSPQAYNTNNVQRPISSVSGSPQQYSQQQYSQQQFPGQTQQQSGGPSGQYGAPNVPAGQYNQGSTGTSQFGKPTGQSGQYVASNIPSGQYNQGSSGTSQFGRPTVPSGQIGASNLPSGQYNQGSTGTSQFGRPTGPSGQIGASNLPSSQYNQGSTGTSQFGRPTGPSGQIGASNLPSGQYNQGSTGTSQFGRPTVPSQQYNAQSQGPFAPSIPQSQTGQGSSGYNYDRPSQGPTAQYNQGSGPRIPETSSQFSKPAGSSQDYRPGSSIGVGGGPRTGEKQFGQKPNGAQSSGSPQYGSGAPGFGDTQQFGLRSGVSQPGSQPGQFTSSGPSQQYRQGPQVPSAQRPASSGMKGSQQSSAAPYQYNPPSSKPGSQQSGSGTFPGAPNQPFNAGAPSTQDGDRTFGGPRQPPSFSPEEGYKY